MSKVSEALEKIGNIILDKTQDENYGEICFRVKHLFYGSYNIIEKELQKPQELYDLIKEKRDNAKRDLERRNMDIEKLEKINNSKELLFELLQAKRLSDRMHAYHDVLCVMQVVFKELKI